MPIDTIDHDTVIRLCSDVSYMRTDMAEVKDLLKAQNGRIRKLEERWWVAMGGLLVASVVVNWVLLQLAPAIVRTVSGS